VLGSLPTFKEPAIDELPEYFEDKEGGIRQAIRQVTKAIAFARWRKGNEDLCKEAFKKIVGEYAEQPDIASYREGEIGVLPLVPKQASFFRLQCNEGGDFIWTQLSSPSRGAG